jgi:hypothetical protein
VTKQNKSHAVMSQRKRTKKSRDPYPTHPWATRALIEHVIKSKGKLAKMSCWEPACGRGHMSKVLREYFDEVRSSDIHRYGYGEVANFLRLAPEPQSVDWIITNPPFYLAKEFILKSLMVARVGVAMLARTVFVESEERYNDLFLAHQPTHVAHFVQRVPMLRGRLKEKASSATSYSWFVWKRCAHPTPTLWIPPCRDQLKRDGDYDLPVPPLRDAR